MLKIVTRSRNSLVKGNRNGTGSNFTKTQCGEWKKMGGSGNSRTEGGEFKRRLAK